MVTAPVVLCPALVLWSCLELLQGKVMNGEQLRYCVFRVLENEHAVVNHPWVNRVLRVATVHLGQQTLSFCPAVLICHVWLVTICHNNIEIYKMIIIVIEQQCLWIIHVCPEILYHARRVKGGQFHDAKAVLWCNCRFMHCCNDKHAKTTGSHDLAYFRLTTMNCLVAGRGGGQGVL